MESLGNYRLSVSRKYRGVGVGCYMRNSSCSVFWELRQGLRCVEPAVGGVVQEELQVVSIAMDANEWEPVAQLVVLKVPRFVLRCHLRLRQSRFNNFALSKKSGHDIFPRMSAEPHLDHD